MLDGLANLLKSSAMLPFVRVFFGDRSEYLWYDDDGQEHSVWQGEGGEQGDPLMPALYSLGQHPALQAVQELLQDDEYLLAFLDDVYFVCQPERVQVLFAAVSEALAVQAGVQVNHGKTRVWNAAGIAPPGVEHLGDGKAWVGDHALPTHAQGLKLLGTRLGHVDFVAAFLSALREGHDVLLRRLQSVPDLQSAWLLLSMCAATRANYYLRALPPSATEQFAAGHDDAMWQTLAALLGGIPPGKSNGLEREIAALPFRLGGLSLRSARRTAPAAWWASWVDAFGTIAKRQPGLARRLIAELDRADGPTAQCLKDVVASHRVLEAEGFQDAPSWTDTAAGVRPPATPQRHGEWDRGWQYQAAAAREEHARDTSILPLLPPTAQALLRSQAGPCGGRVFTTMPTSWDTTMPDAELRVLLLRRLRLAIALADRRCRCRRLLDPYGDHRAACPTAGVLGNRGAPLERAVARVCREAGARVSVNAFVRDLNIDAAPGDGRRLEVVANGLPLWGGAQIAVDTTLVSPVQRDGLPRPRAAEVDGVALQAAELKKRTTYRDVVSSRRCRLVVMALEVGGRWSEEAIRFIQLLARAKARSQPAILRKAAEECYRRRWTGLVAMAAQRAFAASLLGGPLGGLACVDGEAPPLGDVLAGSA